MLSKYKSGLRWDMVILLRLIEWNTALITDNISDTAHREWRKYFQLRSPKRPLHNGIGIPLQVEMVSGFFGVRTNTPFEQQDGHVGCGKWKHTNKQPHSETGSLQCGIKTHKT